MFSLKTSNPVFAFWNVSKTYLNSSVARSTQNQPSNTHQKYSVQVFFRQGWCGGINDVSVVTGEHLETQSVYEKAPWSSFDPCG